MRVLFRKVRNFRGLNMMLYLEVENSGNSCETGLTESSDRIYGTSRKFATGASKYLWDPRVASRAAVWPCLLYTEFARDCDLYNLVSCGKFLLNDILFSTIYKTQYLTLGHHALAVILCLCLNFFGVINSLIVLTKPKKPKKSGVWYFFSFKVTIPDTPGIILE